MAYILCVLLMPVHKHAACLGLKKLFNVKIVLYIVVGPLPRKQSLKQIHSYHGGWFSEQTFL